MMKKISSWIISTAAAAILFWICSLFIQSHDALKWPYTQGRVVSSSLTIKHLPKFLNFSVDPMRWYGADVRYTYSVGGRTYASNRVAIQDRVTGSSRDALKIMNKYRRQKQVMVFYNPVDPQQAVLEPADIGDIYIPVAAGGLLVFLWFIIFSDQSIAINSGRDAHLHQGTSYQKRGKLEEALNEYNKIIGISPYLAIGYISRGSVYLQQGQWDLAIADFSQALAIDPMAGRVYFNRGKAYLGNKQYNEAWVDMQKAMEMGFKVKPDILEKIKKGL